MSAADRRLKVLHIGKYYAPHRGGIETTLRLLCESLAPVLDVEVLVAGETGQERRETVAGVSVVRSGTWLTVASAPICPGMVREIGDAEADLIHLHWPNPAALLAYLASGQRAPLVVSYHSDTVRQVVLGLAFRPILRHGLRRAAAIIAASPNYLESSAELAPFKERCTVIPYGIPTEAFLAADPRAVAEIRETHGSRLVLAAGRLVYYKGLEHLIDAMAEVDGRLLIAGEGPLRRSLERRARRAGVGARVVFLGDVEDLIPYYHAADVFALPSTERSEAFGIVQLEAMACGRPVVNTRIDSGVPYVSPDGVTGLTVPPRNSAALASAINLLLADPARREAYGEAGRRRVAELFRLDRMADATLRLYRRVLDGRAA